MYITACLQDKEGGGGGGGGWHRGRNRMVVGFTNTYAISAYHH